MHATAILTLLFTAPIVAAHPSPAGDDARARELVRNLGAPEYRTRERAARELLALGRPAYRALLDGSRDADPEVRSRSRRLLPAIFDLDLKARLEAFVADVDGLHEHDLPGWERFRKAVGEGRAARDLFASMVRADGRLMEAVENGPADAAEQQLVTRCLVLQQRLYPRNAAPTSRMNDGDVAQVLFLGAVPGLSLSQQGCALINQFLYRPEVREWFASGEHAALMKKLLLAWFEGHLDEANTGNMIANMLNTLQLKELTDVALRVAFKKTAQIHVRANILVALGRTGNKDVVERLQSLIDDDTLVGQFVVNQFRGTTKLGDVALAMSIYLSGEKPADYGFDGVKGSPAAVFSYYRLGFSDDQKRSAARTRWRVQREKGPAK